MTGPDCAVMCNLINIHAYIHTYLLILLLHIINSCTSNTFKGHDKQFHSNKKNEKKTTIARSKKMGKTNLAP